MPPHFLTGAELSAAELDALLDRAIELKSAPLSSRALAGRGVALIFEKPSTRTRVSFEMGVHELGGHAVVLRSGEMQLSRGESPRDTALVLSRQVAAIAVRTGPDSLLEELARYASVPVINMLTALHHPCQALADLMTVRECFGSLTGLRIAYVGRRHQRGPLACDFGHDRGHGRGDRLAAGLCARGGPVPAAGRGGLADSLSGPV